MAEREREEREIRINFASYSDQRHNYNTFWVGVLELFVLQTCKIGIYNIVADLIERSCSNNTNEIHCCFCQVCMFLFD